VGHHGKGSRELSRKKKKRRAVSYGNEVRIEREVKQELKQGVNVGPLERGGACQTEKPHRAVRIGGRTRPPPQPRSLT